MTTKLTSLCPWFRRFALACPPLTLALHVAAQVNEGAPTGRQIPVTNISKVTIHSKHMGWGSSETNLMLVRSNSLFVSANHIVSEAVVFNLLGVVQQPPKAKVIAADLGLNEAWLATNRTRLLKSFGGQDKEAIFPLASPPQRAWLTNALTDLDLLGELISHSDNSFWTDDYPEIELRFSAGDTEIARLRSTAQVSFMLPWEATWGTNRYSTFNAAISRGVASLLPAGFLNRKRIEGDLIGVLVKGFPDHPRVQSHMKQMVLQETFGLQADRFVREFEPKIQRISSGNYGLFPEYWMDTLHRTNWPARLCMPIHARIENGAVPLLRRLVDNGDARVGPIQKSAWLTGLVKGDAKTTIEVAPEGSMADNTYLRGQMAKVGLGDFYDEVKALMPQGLAFTLRDRVGNRTRTSEWIVLPDGKLLLLKFAGGGVLNWSPEELGYRGTKQALNSLSYQNVGVFLTPDGRIEKVVPQAGR